MIKEVLDIYSYYIKEINSTNRDMQTYIDSYKKESEKCAAYPEHSTVHFEYIANITVDSDSVISQEKQNGSEEDCQEDL